MKILDGKIINNQIATSLKGRIKRLKISPLLAIIQVGNLAESNAYIRQKKLFAEKIGARVNHICLPENISQKTLFATIKKLNSDKNTHGLIVQMPIPARLDREKILEAVDVIKDVDGLQSKNIHKLFVGQGGGHVPATARGVIELLDYYRIPLAGKQVTIVGRSNLVGKPIALSLLNKNATVTIAHRYSRNLPAITKSADILIAVAGAPKLIKARHVRKGQVVIDVGINSKVAHVGRSLLVGDVDFPAVSKIVKAISPVPGGVGPMTVAALFENLLDAYKWQNNP